MAEATCYWRKAVLLSARPARLQSLLKTNFLMSACAAPVGLHAQRVSVRGRSSRQASSQRRATQWPHGNTTTTRLAAVWLSVCLQTNQQTKIAVHTANIERRITPKVCEGLLVLIKKSLKT
jgi:hypothetical protein